MAQIILDESAAPSTPSADKLAIYAKTDSKLYTKNDVGTETELGVSKIVQVVEGTPYTTYSSTSTAMPNDDTIPQNTEGAEWVTVSITPTSSTNRLLIEGYVSSCTASSAVTIISALFQDSTANALAASQVSPSAAAYQCQISVKHEMAAGTTSATTFKLRAGTPSGTFYVNGSNSARLLGGINSIRIRVTEIKV